MATILIVDDRAGNRELLIALLRSRNHQVVEASDGAEGLDQARSAHPDLIITDILMPTMDGYEFTRRLQEDHQTAAIPVIYFPANYLFKEARALAAKCGVQFVLSEPFEPEQVLRTVDAALGQGPAVAPVPAVSEFEHIRALTDKLSQKADQLRSLNARLEALVEIGQGLNVAVDPARLVETYCEGARRIVGSARTLIAIVDEVGGRVRHLYASGIGAEDAGQVRARIMTGPHRVCAEASRQQVCRRGTGGPAAPALALDGAAGQPPMHSYLTVPILWRNEALGWMEFTNKIGYEEFTGQDERLATTLAAQLAVAYENTRLFDRMKHYSQTLEREVAERQRSAEKYRMVLEQASDGIGIADEKGRNLEGNPRLLEMLGYTREQFVELSMGDLISPEELAGDPILFDQLRAGNIIRKERQFLRRDGTSLDVELTMSRLGDGRVQSIVRDTAERKQLENQLRQSQKLEAVGRLAGGVAHDFNNLLTVILGRSDLVLGSLDEGDRRRRDMEDIREAGARAALLAAQLLSFSRKHVMQPCVLNINASVSKLNKMLGRLISSSIEIVTRLDSELSPAHVDPVQLDQVILNLAINARDAMPLGGTLTLETANRHFAGEDGADQDVPAGDYVMLAISDTGIGMDAATRSRLSEPFFTTKAAGKGTGLGLWTVYGIVRQSGGYICVYSEPGRGTTFKIYLPRVSGGTEVLPLPDENQPLPTGSETVLLAEDEQRVRSLAAAVLARQGYTVIEAADGEEAVHVAGQYPGRIHLLFTDITMPKMGGVDAAEQLRRSRPGLKVLFCSGYSDKAQEGAMSAGAPFLQKPFTPRTLAFKIREVLDGSHGPRTPSRLLPAGIHTDQPSSHGAGDPAIH